MIRSVREKLKNNSPKKGFTLVELIVVLVILAILAAVAIPLMLGFTDDAREKRYISDANAALKASQTVITEIYNEGGNLLDGTKRYKAWQMAGVDKGAADANIGAFISNPTSWPDGNSEFIVWTGKKLVTNETAAVNSNISSYTIVCAQYKTPAEDGSKVLFYNGKEWKIFDDETALEKNSEYTSLVSASGYGENEIKMWPNKLRCDSAYGTIDVAEKPWNDHDNPRVEVYKVKLHGYKQNGGGVYFIANEFLSDDTPAKRNYEDFEVTYKFDGVREDFDWESARDIKTGYKIKVDGESEGFYELVGWFEPNTKKLYKEEDINSGDFIRDLRAGNISELNARAYQTYDTVKVDFKALYDDTLGFGKTEESTVPVKSVIFRKYRNTEVDYSKNTKMVDSQGNSVPTCSMGQIDEDVILKGGNNYTFGGWAFYPDGYNGNNGSTYETSGVGNAPKQYTRVADLWEKVFSSNPSISGGTDDKLAAQIFNFVGIVQKTQTINLHADENSKFKKSGSLAIYYFHRFAEMAPDEHVDTLDTYEDDKIIANPSYRHTGWTGQVGSYTVTLADKGITEIRNTVAANSGIDEFDFTAKIDPGSRTKFVGRTDSGSAASNSSFVGQILQLSGGRSDSVKLFTRKDYDDAISLFRNSSQISSMFEGLDTTEQDDDIVKSGTTGTIVSITDSIQTDGGYLDQFAILWDGKDDEYDIPAFAYSVVSSNETKIYWVSRSNNPLLDGDFSYAFQGYSAMSFAGCEATAWNTSECTNMAHMFDGCGIGNTQITFGQWDYSNVENMEGMFKSVKNLTNIYLADRNMDKVEYMNDMFMDSTNLTAVTMNGVSATSLNSAKNMFNGCTNVQNITLTGLTTSNTITDVSYMFKGCAKLLAIDVSGLNTSNVEDASYMFEGCLLMNTFTVKKAEGGSDFTFADKIEKIEYMFSKCHSLTMLDLRGFTDCTNLGNVQYWFDECYKMQYIDLSNFRPTNLSNIIFIFNRTGYDTSTNPKDTNKCGIFACTTWGCTDDVITRKIPNTSNPNNDNAYAWMRIKQYNHAAYKSANDYNEKTNEMYYHPESHLKPEEEGAAAVIVTKPKEDKTRLAGGYFMSSESQYYKDWRVNAYPNETFSD